MLGRTEYFFVLQVDMYALRQMGDIDLKDLGIPMVITLPTSNSFICYYFMMS